MTFIVKAVENDYGDLTFSEENHKDATYIDFYGVYDWKPREVTVYGGSIELWYPFARDWVAVFQDKEDAEHYAKTKNEIM